MNEFTRKVEAKYGEQINELTVGIFEMVIEEKKSKNKICSFFISLFMKTYV